MRVVGRYNERGFSLVEMVVAIAIAVVLGWLLFHALGQALLAGRMQAARDAEQNSIGQLTDHLTNEEDDAWAIYVPPSDVFGLSNGDGHEVDFFTRDGKQQSYFWAYDYDAGTKTVYRYRFSSPGGIPTKDTSYSGIVKFYAHTYPLTALQDPSTPVYSTLYNGATLRSGVVHFYPNMPWIAGGNNITYVHFEGATINQDLELVTQTAPSGFTIVLSYTPSPSPAPTTQPTPVVWPVAIQFAAPGTTIAPPSASQAMNARRYGIAAALNALLGGGVAQAQVIPRGGCRLDCPTPGPRPTINRTPTPAPTLPPTSPPIFFSPTPQPTPTPPPATPTPLPVATATPTPVSMTPAPGNGCSAVAYADANMSQPLPPGAKNPYTGAVVVDANGCYIGDANTRYLTVHEGNYMSPFINGPTSCDAGVKAGGWLEPNGAALPNGPTSSQAFTAVSPTKGICSITFLDASSQPVIGYALVSYPNPMYAQVNLVYSGWTYDCADETNGHCWNGGWVGTGGGTTYTEYLSTDQGATWSVVAKCSSATACPYPAQFVDSETSCTQDMPGGPCGPSRTGYDRNEWSPSAPPNAP